MRPLAILAFLLQAAAPALDSADAAREPVLVELFTSEGCSTCPPADALLAKLCQLQPVAGVEVIALEEHVDYWDRQGWRDPFSSAEFTARQVRYVETLHVESPYTPEMVVDGHSELVGSDSERALREVAAAGSHAKPPMKLAVKGRDGDRVTLAISSGAPGAADVWLAITESGLASDVSRGENAGHRLARTMVVRKLISVGKVKANEKFEAEPVIKLAPSWNIEHLRAVVFEQERDSKRVLGVAEVTLKQRG
jgi:hypothetical protein